MADIIYNNSADFIFHNDEDIDTGDLWWMRNIPALTTNAIADLTDDSVTANGIITELGGENSTRRGFCYKIGDSGDPTILDTVIYDDGNFSLGAFLEAIASLTTGKKYQIRAYAVNSAGVGYGNTISIITDLALSDSVIFADVLNNKNIGLNKSDSVDIADAIVKNVSILLQDSIDITDALITNTIKDLQEQIIFTDGIIKNITIVKDDHAHFYDNINLFMGFLVTLNDTVVFRDSISKNIDHPIDDTFNLYDAIVKNASIPEQDIINLSDGLIKNAQVNLQDAIIISDTIINNLSFALQDQVIFIDSIIRKNIGLGKSDTIILSDSLYRNMIHHLQDLFVLRDDFSATLITGVAEYFRDMVISGKVKSVLSQLKVKQILSKVMTREALSENIRQVNLEPRRRQVMCTPVDEQGTNDLLEFSTKQTWEEYYVAFNFARVITPLTTIQSTVILVYDEAGTEVSETLTDDTKTQITGAKVFVWVRGGTEQVYKITCRITMSNGEKFEQDATLEVVEV